MQHPFKHPLATHAAMTVLGYRRNGAPIYAIAGGSDEGEGGSGSGGQSGSGDSGASEQGGDGSAGQGSDQGGQAGGQSGSGDGEPDWKALARQWEKRAKENKGAADELAALKQQSMTEQEKAVTEAEKRGRTAAAVEHGQALADARFEAAAAQAGVNLGEAAELINTARFVGEDGTVDADAIKAAVKKLAKLAPKGPGRSGGDFSGGGGDQPSVDKQIADAESKRDYATAIRLKRQKAAQTN